MRALRLPMAILATLLAVDASGARAAEGLKPRARDLGVPLEGAPGPLNAITDVAGVEVGFTTLVSGEPGVPEGEGPVRTGVTAVFPRGRDSTDPVFAAWFTLNGNGEMTGTTWVEESGFLEGPVMITNTHSVGVVRDAVVRWQADQGRLDLDFSLPVVAETYDMLNDINGQHVEAAHAIQAIEAAASGPVAEGNVGGGVGMICHGFKGGTGTASRRVRDEYTVGVLVQCNYGSRRRLTVAGVPVGRELEQPKMCFDSATAPNGEETMFGISTCASGRSAQTEDRGSIIIVVATDAPFLPHQLERLVKRASLAVGRMGGLGGNSSGDIFIAFSTANPDAAASEGVASLTMLPNERMNGFFKATVEATEEAILNSMIAAETMTGAYFLRVPALRHADLRRVLREYRRLEE